MKKILFLMALLPMMLLTACSDDDTESKEIKNLSGKTWYDTQVWFMTSTDAESLDGYQEVGDISVGESCTVNSDKGYFYIYAKDNRGKLIMSKPKRLSSSNSVIFGP